ncbi:hypothetical protein PTI98_009539 [Pleurotus ostreatus]|nr:hypothetical protein PTI98_009539 [Pleurotus ostreatus]
MSHNLKKSDDCNNMIIVGGGAAGITLARTVSAKITAPTHNIFLVNPRPFQVIDSFRPSESLSGS